MPTVALMVVAGIGVATQARAYQQADSTVSSVRLVLVAQGLVHELQRERGLTNGLLGGQEEYANDVIQQRARADAARGELERALNDAPTALAAPVRDALQALADQGDVRTGVDAGSADRASTLEYYTTAIVRLADASATEESAVSDASLRAGLESLRTLGLAKEATALERGFLNGVFSADAFRGREYPRFAEIRAERIAGLTAFTRQATASQQAALDVALSSDSAAVARELEQRAIDGPTAPSLGVSPTQWWDTMTVLVDDMRTVQTQVGADVETRATELRSNALALLLLNVGLAIVALAVAIGLAVLAARSITRPLQLVAAEAARLPETVAKIRATDGTGTDVPPSPSAVRELDERNDEISEVSRALTQVQHTAFRLASEQAQLRRNTAESLSSLARRNQNLLRRLLGFITHLERDESDSAALANLFELDHLATRMRRNAESLLILVGERSPRQWSRPVPISDVVRAALAEVEEYRRVVLHRLEETMITGAAGAELAHLIAELLENALSFSPPDRDVEVYGQLTGSGYVLAVLDHGIGMSTEELARANGRLAGEELFVVAPTRYLGHYVVGQLAQRLGVEVRLHESPLTGVTARINLPASLIAAPPALEGITAFDASNAEGSVNVPISRPFRLRLDRNPPADSPIALLETPPAVPPSEPPAAGRTRNGLVKRVRSGEGEPVPRPHPRPHPEPEPDGDRPAAPFRSPAEVRTSLNSFRAGFERREHERTRATEEGRGVERPGDPR
ncbi:MAG: Putative sensor and ATPase, component of G-protein-coupled receptor (GPCR) system [uncultured Pseudonocardia sp.]|uniref:histidine kinase n=1 Tax=uncultured Pseudonocardia sp. TaxID=211455 RepID=A0A6J4QJ90_9PSEU|nr:MAG: Putative sensor and ATPase, component of G-protein-coupled receptor (GPCR) system [uncultured Pseudonocardia sp.]